MLTIQQIFLKLVESDFVGYQSPESLIINLNTFKLMLHRLTMLDSFDHPIELIDGSFARELTQMQEEEVYSKVLILRTIHASIPHYFVLYAEKKEGSARCILLDASNCAEHFGATLTRLKDFFSSVLVVVGDNQLRKIQNDTKSCPFFAMEHALLLAKTKDPFADFAPLRKNINSILMLEELKLRGEIEETQVTGIQHAEILSNAAVTLSFVRWVQVRFEYVMHMQTVSGLDYYIRENRENAERMLRHKDRSVQPRDFLGTRRLVNFSLIHRSREIQGLIMRMSDATDITALLHVHFQMHEVLQKLGVIFDSIPSQQYNPIYRFLFPDMPLPQKLINKICENLQILSESAQALELIQANKLDLITLLSHPKMLAIINSPVLLELIDEGIVNSTSLGIIRSRSQLEQLDSSELLVAIRSKEVSFETVMRKRGFNLSQYRLGTNGDGDVLDGGLGCFALSP